MRLEGRRGADYRRNRYAGCGTSSEEHCMKGACRFSRMLSGTACGNALHVAGRERRREEQRFDTRHAQPFDELLTGGMLPAFRLAADGRFRQYVEADNRDRKKKSNLEESPEVFRYGTSSSCRHRKKFIQIYQTPEEL